MWGLETCYGGHWGHLTLSQCYSGRGTSSSGHLWDTYKVPGTIFEQWLSEMSFPHQGRTVRVWKCFGWSAWVAGMPTASIRWRSGCCCPPSSAHGGPVMRRDLATSVPSRRVRSPGDQGCGSEGTGPPLTKLHSCWGTRVNEC